MDEALRRAVFVDRDGVICQNRRDHVKRWDEFVFLPGATDALARLASSDWQIVVVTNQAIINRGIVSDKVVADIHDRMVRQIEAAGGRIDKVYWCPHRPNERCFCRKPNPGMILQAAADLEIDIARSCMIGDAITDLEAGLSAGCEHGYLVLTGRGSDQLADDMVHDRTDVTLVADLGAAVEKILDHSQDSRSVNGSGSDGC